MSEIVIRHAEPKDYDAIRQIHAQPEVYHNTLQVPHPSLEMWQARLTEQAGVKQLVACIDDIVVGHLSIQVTQRPRRSHVADFGICVDARWHNRGIASALIRTMIDMCDNWLRVERIELMYKKYGFEIEGTGKKYGLRNGEYVDAYFMARVK
ncbi:N-acetyltransferase [Salmonella enterica]|uniref:N-acetyltransferase n=1 Tax=Salmonella enterica TaxID=28901 RepID=UPI0012D0E123|nr:N-acetyltransferase [Salmonella enterica]ECB4065515.1 N-acetyltransferase [Salmonella enterica subsp. enterica serovar Agona]EIC0238531.1 N-acetyltransferase [Salmonella enterica subsp. enterica serovar Agona]EIC4007745.1 N-acetyltransferase [Salmonella enterica subsp. enterica serovar Agona]EJZ7612528.1 N-acetyltransferase [Salmonella enterica]EKA2209949.1 N-acetyltransferase [Salmonella enterica]